MNWDDLRYVLAVVREGSMSGAARALSVNHATVIRRVRGLERGLGASLFDRDGHHYVISPAGEVVLEAAERMEAQAATAERLIAGQSTALSGTVRITAPEPMGTEFLLPAVREFNGDYPDIVVDISLSRRAYDLGRREADLAIRVTTEPPLDVVGFRITPLYWGIYGPAGCGLLAADVEKVIVEPGASAGVPDWVLQFLPQARVSLMVDAVELEVAAIKAGYGVARLATQIGDADPALERLADMLPQYLADIWLLTHVDVRSNARIRVFRDFLIDYFEHNHALYQPRNLGAR
ncbi:LysR family transcriptional regulator [Halieaceae bacterium IMCC14734]|uniref:LysR family transcriptional regulator n=1 Tax=Candidatus Litorirhabdus singularis TaxID=2518993 RepID=A0ABT3TD80_9GAMM|nr:LysR family transcriptional regulator [Candidatus Litorirhabdus singularis]MCX2980229.1 LysR family transcriptional regulator [Candidatus Litorirhabdus singularis]